MMRRVRRLLVLATAGATVAALQLVNPSVAGAGLEPPTFGGEFVIIDSVTVDPSLEAPQCANGQTVLPVTIVATFIVPDGKSPVGPYATAGWSGGYGGVDDHFGTAQGHNMTQTFHVLLLPSDSDFGGAGDYTGWVIVQDVGLAGGYDELDTVPIKIKNAAPYGAGFGIKCPQVHKEFDPTAAAEGLLKTFAQAARDLAEETEFCPMCVKVFDEFKKYSGYIDKLNRLLNDEATADPPDDDYEQLARPDPPAILPPDAGLTTAQANAVTAAESAVATAIGSAQALLTTTNRVWGAGNAGSEYWYRRQIAALAQVADKTATDVRALTAAFGQLASAFAGVVPQYAITQNDVSQMMRTLVDGLPADLTGILTQLGETPAQLRETADYMLHADPNQLATSDASTDLFAAPLDFNGIADALSGLRAWADATAMQPRPEVTGMSTHSTPTGGGEEIDITGSNLDSATGVSFGASTESSGLADFLGCESGTCSAIVPPGSGSVRVRVSGPGGVSDDTSADEFHYTTLGGPTVNRIFPALGSTAGGQNVEVYGTNLRDANLYFGPTPAAYQECTATACTVQTPPSENTTTVDVAAEDSAGLSDESSADRYTFTAVPPALKAPSVTAVSPASGALSGGETVTVTGHRFSQTTDVLVGDQNAQFTIIDDSHLQIIAPGVDSPSKTHIVVSGAGNSSKMTSASVYTYTRERPTITSVSPTHGTTTGGNTLTIKGTHLTGAFISSEQAAFTADASCTPSKCTVVAPANHAGTTRIEATTNDGDSVNSAGDKYIYVKAPKPTVDGVEPSTGTVQGGTEIVVRGNNLGGGTVVVGKNTAVPVSLDSCTNTSCVVTTPSGKIGADAVTVRTEAGRSAITAADSFRYTTPGAPTVTGVGPNTGEANGTDEVIVTGTNLEYGTVYFGTRRAYSYQGVDQECTTSLCDVLEPGIKSAGPVNVTVKTRFGTSAVNSRDTYTYYRPKISSVTPTSGWTLGGQQISIRGTNFNDGTVQFVHGGDVLDGGAITCADMTCVGTTPAAGYAGTYDIEVGDLNTTSAATSADQYTYKVLGDPSVSGLSMTTGTDDGGDTVVVSGTNLDGGTVDFGGEQATASSCTHTSCTAITPRTADGKVDVVVHTQLGTSATDQADVYTFAPAGRPTVSGVSPASGSASGGTTVVVSGTNLTNGQVHFGDAALTDSSCTVTACTFVSPAGTGTVPVTVTTDGGTSATSSSDHFTFQTPPKPTVTSVSPDNGPASGNTYVTVTGAHLYGALLTLGSIAVTSAGCSDTSCTANLPAATAGTYDITATTGGGTSTSSTADRFSVAPITLTEIDYSPDPTFTSPGGGHLVAAADGTAWFTEPLADGIGHIGTDDTVSTLPTPDSSSEPDGIVQTRDGDIWWAERKTNELVSRTPSGTTHTYQLPGVAGDIRGLAVGADGRLWFTLGISGSIGAMTESGTFSSYPLPNYLSNPANIVEGPDRRLWFTESDVGAIGAISVSGVVHEYPIGALHGEPWDIAVGADGRLWFTELAQSAIGAITTSGAVSQYPLARGHYGLGIASGGDGRMWFSEHSIDELGAIAPSGTVSNYPLANAPEGAQPHYMAMAHDGSVWAALQNVWGVVKVTGVTTGVPPSVLAVSPVSGAPSGGTQVTIAGANLGSATGVLFGSKPATSVTAVDATHVTAVAPAGSGTVQVQVMTSHGTTGTSTASAFSYGAPPATRPVVSAVSPDHGPVGGGTKITINGIGLDHGSVSVDGHAATSVSCTTSTCTANTPAGAAGPADVIVTTSGGTTSTSSADQFIYQSPAARPPSVASLTPSSGSTSGGTTVTIHGTNLSGGIVSFGQFRASATCTATKCTATSPPGGVGQVDVAVLASGGLSATRSADLFTYKSS